MCRPGDFHLEMSVAREKLRHVTVEFEFRTRSTVSISLPLTLPLSFPSHLSFPTPEKTRMMNSHDSGSRVSPAPLSPPVSPSQQGEFFFSFFSQFIFFFEQCSTFRPRWLPPTLAPTTSHCRPPTSPLARTAATATAARYPVGLCPDLSLRGAIPRHVLRAGKFSAHCACLAVHSPTAPPSTSPHCVVVVAASPDRAMATTSPCRSTTR